MTDFWDADCAALEPQKVRAARRSVQRKMGTHGRREHGRSAVPSSALDAFSLLEKVGSDVEREFRVDEKRRGRWLNL